MTEELLTEEPADEIALSERVSEPADEITLSERVSEPADEITLSERVSELLDFTSDTSTRSGDGWAWNKDTATLTLNDLNLILSEAYYSEDYKAAVTLPAADDLGLGEDDYVTVELCGDSTAIAWAYENKIIGGYSDGTFGIKDNCTRQQIVTMLYKYKHLK